MTIAELRVEIAKEIEKLPDSVLPGLLAALQRLNAESSNKERRELLFQRILEEDGGLFKRLAQYDTKL